MKTNTPNPLIPQGTFPPHRKSHVRLAVFSILAVHLILLGALLLQGCKRTADSGSSETTNTAMTPEFEGATNYSLAIEPARLPNSQAEPEQAIISEPAGSIAPAVAISAPPPIQPTRTTPLVLPPTTHPVEATGVASTHIVLKGENFFTIGKKYGVSSKAIAAANPKVNPRSLKIGEKLTIPAPPPPSAPAPAPGNLVATPEGSLYIVKSGDNLSTIAEHFGTTVSALRSANALTTDRIKVGDKLKIPPATRADSGAGAPRYP